MNGELEAIRALEAIAALVHRESGMLLREGQLDALAGSLGRIDAGGDPQAFLDRLLDPTDGPGHIRRLLDEVTVKETFFLRDLSQLQRIDWPVLLQQAWKNGASKIRIWSAGCATGEEAYSLALLACEAFTTLEPPVTILATDISRAALARAGEGIYRARSTRELTPDLRHRYFQEKDDQLVVSEALRALVKFTSNNLVHDPVPPLGEPPFDAILCRNVLIYFDRDTVDRVITRLESALAPGGELILGVADALCRGTGHVQALREERPGTSNQGAAGTTALRRPLGRLRPVPDAIADDPLDAAAHFLRGLAAVEAGNPLEAIPAFRAALYADPLLGLAAFQLGRSYEAIGNSAAARRAYEQALAGLEPDLDANESFLSQIDLNDVKAAIRIRLELLKAAETTTSSVR